MEKSAVDVIRALDLSPKADDNAAMGKLRGIREALQDKLREAGGRAEVILSPGFRVNAGQEQRVVVDVPKRNYRETLFRAYVPPAGFPIQFDFYGEEPAVCQTLEEADAAVAEFFSNPDTLSRLRSYVDISTPSESESETSEPGVKASEQSDPIVRIRPGETAVGEFFRPRPRPRRRDV